MVRVATTTLCLFALACSATPTASPIDGATDASAPSGDAKHSGHDGPTSVHDAARSHDSRSAEPDAPSHETDARGGGEDAGLDADDATAVHDAARDQGTDATDSGSSATRNASLWPFAASDPFNIGIGNAASWSTTWSTTGSNVNGAQEAPSYSIPVYVATSSSPVQTINGVSLKIPSGAAPASGTDHHMTCVQPKGAIAAISNYAMYGFYGVTKTTNAPPDTYTNGSYGTNGPFDLTAYSTHYDGRASSILQMGGLMRSGEVVAGVIPHAIAAALNVGSMAPGFIWPASSQDSNTSGYTGTTHMGAVLGIPSSVQLSSLGLTAGGLMLATALQDYGAIVVDTGGSDGVIFYAEDEYDEGINTAAFTTSIGQMASDLTTIATHLKLLSNQQTSQAALTSDGGWGSGSTHSRAPTAPPFE
jgi:hypothetical protein